jgi:hypothetical protein
MLVNVPQYIDVEDKIIGPITAKQLGWLIGMGVTLLMMWSFLDKPTFFLTGIPFAFLILAFAFYRPYGQTFGSFVVNGFYFMFRPKIFIWKRIPEKIQTVAHIRKEASVSSSQNQKRLTYDELKSLSAVVDSDGKQSNEHILEIIRNAKIKNKK